VINTEEDDEKKDGIFNFFGEQKGPETLENIKKPIEDEEAKIVFESPKLASVKDDDLNSIFDQID